MDSVWVIVLLRADPGQGRGGYQMGTQRPALLSRYPSDSVRRQCEPLVEGISQSRGTGQASAVTRATGEMGPEVSSQETDKARSGSPGSVVKEKGERE